MILVVNKIKCKIIMLLMIASEIVCRLVIVNGCILYFSILFGATIEIAKLFMD